MIFQGGFRRNRKDRSENKMTDKNRNTAGVFLLLAGLALFVYGTHRLEPDVVMMKAITICMECIGIG